MPPELSRRKSRQKAMETLFQWELAGDPEFDSVKDLFAKQLAQGTWTHKQQLDENIEKASQNWSLKRINTLDLCLIRMALFEMSFMTPPSDKALVIHEAIDLAQKFSTKKSHSFIQGVLNAVEI